MNDTVYIFGYVHRNALNSCLKSEYELRVSNWELSFLTKLRELFCAVLPLYIGPIVLCPPPLRDWESICFGPKSSVGWGRSHKVTHKIHNMRLTVLSRDVSFILCFMFIGFNCRAKARGTPSLYPLLAWILFLFYIYYGEGDKKLTELWNW